MLHAGRADMVASGVHPHKVHVVTHGVRDDPRRCFPTADAAPGPSAEGGPPDVRGAGATQPFTMLFHGGLLWRKGIDVVLRAYAAAFTHTDPVVLIVHGNYGNKDVAAFVGAFQREMYVPCAPCSRRRVTC